MTQAFTLQSETHTAVFSPGSEGFCFVNHFANNASEGNTQPRCFMTEDARKIWRQYRAQGYKQIEG